MNKRTADNCSFTSNVSTNVLPFSKRIWMRVFEYDFGVFVADDVDDGSAMVTVALGVEAIGIGFPESLFEIKCKKNTNNSFIYIEKCM